MKKVQHEKSATRKKCNLELEKHEKSATRKKCSKRIVQHDQSIVTQSDFEKTTRGVHNGPLYTGKVASYKFGYRDIFCLMFDSLSLIVCTRKGKKKLK